MQPNPAQMKLMEEHVLFNQQIQKQVISLSRPCRSADIVSTR